MVSTIFLYGYGAVCVAMLIYNLLYNFIMRSSDKRLDKRKEKLRKQIRVQLERIEYGHGHGDVDDEHLTFLQKKLVKINYLIAFDHVMRELQEDYPIQTVAEYRNQIQPVTLHLAQVYKDRDSMQAAYFAYLLPHIKTTEAILSEKIMVNILIEYMNKKSLYCRVNALQALCDIGTDEGVFRALHIMDTKNGVMHDKVITDILMTYQGDYNELIRVLLSHFEEFSPRLHLSLINYIRFRSSRYCRMMYTLATDENRDKDIRVSAIRYFGKYYYEPAKEQLIAFAEDENPERWEYAAAAATVLANYDGEDVLHALKHAIHSTNWYVRYNAAESLQAHHLEHSDLLSVVSGSDRFAREMMMYRLNVQRLEEERNESI